MSAATENAQRLFQQGATKAQLIRTLLDTDIADLGQLATFLELLMYDLISGPWGGEHDDIPPGAANGLLWTVGMLSGDDERDMHCPELVLAMQEVTPTDKATGWLLDADAAIIHPTPDMENTMAIQSLRGEKRPEARGGAPGPLTLAICPCQCPHDLDSGSTPVGSWRGGARHIAR